MEKKQFEILDQFTDYELRGMLTDSAYCAFMSIKYSPEITHCSYELLGNAVKGHVSGGTWFTIQPVLKMGFIENGIFTYYSDIKKYFE
jgi:hypothetical protein